ncbi:MAG: hypothetical protein JXJ17_00365 [Anaerolineae bacterium]|nr:hypothetical protein [Anaerolineae bacterium]
MNNIVATWFDTSKTQILLTYQNGWTWDDWLSLDETLVQWLNRADHEIDLVHDIRSAELPMDTLSRLPVISSRTVGPCHPRAGNVAIAGSGPSQEILADILSRLYDNNGRHIQSTPSIEEAADFLVSCRQLLDTGQLN